jgi:uncharacterized protein YndB with AHSA1/START domain
MTDDAMVREITITHVFDAPRELVWRAWTEAEQLKHWFMPHGFTVPECEVDFRPGGAYRMTVRGPTARSTRAAAYSRRSNHRHGSSSRRPHSKEPTAPR